MSDAQGPRQGAWPTWKARAAAYLSVVWILPCSMIGCWMIGDYLDRRFGASYWGMVGTVLGLAAGFYETIRQTLRIGKHGR